MEDLNNKNPIEEQEKEDEMTQSKCSKKRFIYAYDPKIQRRVVHVVSKKCIATSLITGHKFKYQPQKGRK